MNTKIEKYNEFIRVFSHDFLLHERAKIRMKIEYLKNSIIEMKRNPPFYFIHNQKDHDKFCLIVKEEIYYLKKTLFNYN